MNQRGRLDRLERVTPAHVVGYVLMKDGDDADEATVTTDTRERETMTVREFRQRYPDGTLRFIIVELPEGYEGEKR